MSFWALRGRSVSGGFVLEVAGRGARMTIDEHLTFHAQVMLPWFQSLWNQGKVMCNVWQIHSIVKSSG